MSRDLGLDVPSLEKLYARKLWADFPFLVVTVNIGPPAPAPPCSFFWGGGELFFPCEEFLVLNVFPFFSKDFGGLVGIKNPCFGMFFLVALRSTLNNKRKPKDAIRNVKRGESSNFRWIPS